MWFEPSTFPDIFPLFGSVHNVGFRKPPGGKKGSTKHVLNDHSYCHRSDMDVVKCKKWHEEFISTRTKNAEKLGIPFFLTEFGACYDQYSCEPTINNVTGIADEYLTSWAYYQYKPFNGDFTTIARGNPEGFWNQDGSLQEYKVKALSRSYMPFTQGNLTSVNFNPSTAAFTAEFTYSAAATAVTVVYLN